MYEKLELLINGNGVRARAARRKPFTIRQQARHWASCLMLVSLIWMKRWQQVIKPFRSGARKLR